MPVRRPGPGCIALLVDSSDRFGYAGAAPADRHDLEGLVAGLRACWPRQRVLVSVCVPGTETRPAAPSPGFGEQAVVIPSPLFSDARRLRTLPIPRGAFTAVLRPGALLVPAGVLRAALERARRERLDLTTVDGLVPEVFYVVSARALAVAEAASGTAGAATIPLAIERLRALGLSAREVPVATARLPARDVGWADGALADALAAHAWKGWPAAPVLALDSTSRLPAALRMQAEDVARDRARLAKACQPAGDADGRRRPVLVTVPSMYQSGANAAWEELVCTLPPEEVAFVCGRNTALQRVLAQRGFLTWQTSDGLAARSARDAAVLFEALAATRPDVVHFDGAEGSTWAPTVCASGMRIVQHVRLNDLDRFGAAFAFADAVVAVAPHLQRRITARLGPSVRVDHIADGIDLQRRPLNVRPRRVDRRLRCLCAGRIEPEKGTRQVLEIVRALAALVPCDLLLVGSCGNDPAYCDAVISDVLAAAPPLTATWRSFTHPIDALYAEADVVITGSRNEALGMVGLEALAAGCLLVARRSAGYSTIVDESQSEGVLFEGTEPAAAVAARVAAALGARERYAAGGRRKVETTFDARMTAERLLSLWRDVRAGRARGAGGAPS